MPPRSLSSLVVVVVVSCAIGLVGVVGCTGTPGVAEGNDRECPEGEELCGAECIDLDVDPDHCGECNEACESKTNAEVECVAGTCEWSCNPGWIDDNGDLDEPGGGCETECEETNDGVPQCDGRDNNCDGTVDTGFDVGEECVNDEGECDNEGEYVCTDDGTDVECDAEPLDEQTWYEDADGDGYGNPDESKVACEQPEGYVDNDEDCDDTNPAVNPSASPTCDGQDTNCDGTVDTGFPSGEECVNDEGECDNEGEYVCLDTGLDVECDAEPLDKQTWYEDADGDGYGNPDEPKVACEQPEDYVDNDLDCDDTDPEVYPGAGPRCDGQDTNCDGVEDHMIAEGPGQTVSFAGASLSSQGDEFPPNAMATDYEGTDGFCLAVYDEDLERVGIAEIDHDGTASTAVSDTEFGDGRLLDVETRQGRCTVLVSADEGADTGTLWALRFSVGSILAAREIHDELYLHDGQQLSASVYGRDDSQEAWAIVFASFDSWSQGNSIEYVALPEYFGDSSGFTVEDTLNSGLHSPRDIEVGPSPWSADDFLLTWQHTGTPGVTSSGLYADRYSSGDVERQEEWNALDSDYVMPMLTEVDGQYGGSTVLRGFRDQGSDSYWFDELRLTSLGDDALIGSEDDGSYVGRDPITDTGADGLWWFVDPYTNTSHKIDGGGSGYYGVEEFSDPNVGSGDELLAASEAETGVSVLRMTDDDPFSFEVDRVSCY